jgi:hypothetical protein
LRQIKQFNAFEAHCVLLVTGMQGGYVGFSSRDGVAAIVAQILAPAPVQWLRMPMPTKALITKPAPIIDIWTFSATPYAWATMMNGSVTVKGRTGTLDRFSIF